MTKKILSVCLVIGLMIAVPACKSTQKVTTQASTDQELGTVAPATEAAPSIDQVRTTGEAIPFDPETRVGKLDNGLTYYIRQNKKPENFAELRLAINAGSLLEEDNQLGLAHFLEHMCFNGTENFPKSELVDYLEGIGTKFGAHLNAYTSFDETVYMLKIPTDDPEKFDKGLQILEDWAHNVTMDPEEIEKERGVVISEWRTRLGAMDRMQQETLPVLFYGSKYPDRLPIGTTEVLESFKPETLRKFYEDWYRPELMAVVAVGDFDMDKVELQIKEKFGRIPKTKNGKERTIFDIPGHKDTKIAIAQDEESPYNILTLMYKHPHAPVNTMEAYRLNMVQQLASSMLQERLTELTQSANPPFSFAFGGYGASQARSMDAFNLAALVPPNKFETALEALITEQQRAYKHGFTATELERVKKSRIASLEKSFKEKDKTESASIVDRYVQHYLTDSPVLGIENSLQYNKTFLPGISLEEVNAAFKKMIREDNQVVTIMATKKEGNKVPTESELLAVIDKAKNMEVDAYVDKVSDAPLMAEKPAPGRIMMESEMEEVEASKLKLSNGATVILKPTTFKDDEIQLTGFSWGGTSLYSDEEYMSASYADAIVASSGVGEYDEVQLGKFLSDKVVGVSPYINELSEGIQGSSSVKDLETLFQLVNLYFTKPRKDETAFASLISQQSAFLGNMLSNPQSYFSNEVGKILSNNHPRRGFPTEEKLQQIKLDDAFRIYQERFADASDFTFVFVGNFEVEEIKPLIKNYIASLPRIKRDESYKDVGVQPLRGVVEKEFHKGKEPQSQVRLIFTGDFEYTSKNRFDFDAATRVLSIMMRESMREDKGGVYGVGVYGSASRRPKEEYSMNVSFTCDPKDAEELIATALKDVKTLQEEGPSEKNMLKVKEILRKENEENLKQNRFWLNGLASVMRNETEPGNLLKAIDKIEALTAKDVQDAAKKYLNSANYGKFILYPEQEGENK